MSESQHSAISIYRHDPCENKTYPTRCAQVLWRLWLNLTFLAQDWVGVGFNAPMEQLSLNIFPFNGTLYAIIGCEAHTALLRHVHASMDVSGRFFIFSDRM